MVNPVQTIDGTSQFIEAPTDPTDFRVLDGGSLTLGGVVNPADTITVASASYSALSTVKIADVRDSGETINFYDGVVDLDGLSGVTESGATFNYLDAWNLTNGVLSLTEKGQVVAQYKFHDNSPEAGKTANIELAQSGTGIYITEGTLGQPAGAVLLPGNLGQPTPPAPRALAVQDNTTGTQPSGATTPYSGPVAGIQQQFADITPDNLNITCFADNLFISTGSGNDAVALHGGTNVVDAGTGSNYLVSGAGASFATTGSGFDTFFLDARNIPAASSAAGPVPGAIWDTIQGFGHGDAVTLWGITPGTALDWQKNEGAVGHTGLTLHANMPNGSEASLTLAGVGDKSHLALSYGQSGGVNYLYVKAV